jgi:CubicO group peptidase (beta-lactamase class C family)
MLMALLSLFLLSTIAQSAAPLDSVDRYVSAELARERIPGLSLAVLRGDTIVLARGYGYANVEHDVPATDSTIYQSGSVGKQFTAAAVVMLSQEGRLGLGDPLTRYLPEGRGVWRGVTIRHLLTHTSGIPDYADSTLDYRRPYSEADLVRLAAKLPLRFPPGERWSYSNTGYLLLGAVIRKVTGTFYGDFLRERIFGPTGMRTARIISESAIVRHRAAGYELVDGKLQNQSWVSPELNTTADGSLYLSVRDLSAWAIALNHGKVPDRSVLEASWTPVRLNNGGIYPYGFGWSIGEQPAVSRLRPDRHRSGEPRGGSAGGDLVRHCGHPGAPAGLPAPARPSARWPAAAAPHRRPVACRRRRRRSGIGDAGLPRLRLGRPAG